MKKLAKQYLVGLTDGEGSFCVFIRTGKKPTWHTRVECHYYIKLREDDLNLLRKVKHTLGCGRISFQKEYRPNQRDNYRYQVSNLQDLTKTVIPFFKRYRLQGKKELDFKLFCQIVPMVMKKKHHSPIGLRKIKQLKSLMHQ